MGCVEHGPKPTDGVRTVEQELREHLPDQETLRAINAPAVFCEVTGENQAVYEFLHLKTQESIDIVRDVLPDILNRFLAKNVDYHGAAEMPELGPEGDFPKIWGKMGKLKAAVWDKKSLDFEQPDELIDDLVGHLLLMKLRMKSH